MNEYSNYYPDKIQSYVDQPGIAARNEDLDDLIDDSETTGAQKHQNIPVPAFNLVILKNLKERYTWVCAEGFEWSASDL